MVVLIELLGMQREITRIGKIKMPITERTLVRDALEYIRSRYPALTLEENSILTTVNHELSPLNRPLKANDNICILPHIGGG
jgi:molybdopterin converting factor small subunit